MNNGPALPHDPNQRHNRRGKLVPVTTWHWVPGTDADDDLQHDQMPPTASVDYAQPLITPVNLQQTHNPYSPQIHTGPIHPTGHRYNGSVAPSASDLFNLAIAQTNAQPQYPQPDMIQFPDYSQAFTTSSNLSIPFENHYNPEAPYRADNSITPFRDDPTITAGPTSAWPSSVSGTLRNAFDGVYNLEMPPDVDPVWIEGNGPPANSQNSSAHLMAPFGDSPSLYSDIIDTFLANIQEASAIGDATDEERINGSISPFSQSTTATKNVSPQTTIPTPQSEITSSDLGSQIDSAGRTLRKRARSPGAVKHEKIIQNEGGKVQGMTMVWQGQKAPNRKLDDVTKADRKRRKNLGTCSRCKRLKQPCKGFKESPYLPCIACRTSNPTTITSVCLLEASLLNIALFRMGPPVDNPFHPLNFFSHRQNILCDVAKGDDTSNTLELELMQDDVGQMLTLTVSRFAPLPGDKVAYEGIGEEGPYKLDMPPYCISDIKKAQQSLITYMRKAKSAYFNRFVDRSNALLFNTFKMAAMCDFTKRPLINKALDIWAATRLIERTWKMCGSETLGIHPVKGRSDPWKGFVPVTPIMDQQLDQVVIREILVPRRNQLLAQLKEKVYNEYNRKLHAFEVYMTFFILLNNAEVQIAFEREFAQRYGFSGRFGPRGKYMDAEAQFHAARTMLGHFHYICRANSLLTTSPEFLKELGIGDTEKKYLEFVRRQVELQAPHFTKLVQEHRYETTMYFCHQMLFNEWKPGYGHIEELPEMTVGEVMAAA
ncbi:hypothetical protein N0V83_007557 [Neocucurbitaria cava]|uniref:Zn(2)-C6 fungal-type domain-containing protein n=1 Tax=Neocucurbitaria cava TaxID=798079 RepID=A0A9W9CKE4_9PLEO|nr:hypothetical protein N0V83_007557 [Neocucurbitaria cava]